MGHGARGLLAPTARPGATSPTTTPAAAPTAGARTGCSGSRDRQCRLCFALALWNGKDPILKERLFGLTGPEGNHGEDVKELYYYLDSTPTHSYMKALYKYPQARVPLRAAGRGEPPARARGAGVRAHRHRRLRRRALLRRRRRSTPRRSPNDILIRDHGGQPRARRRRSSTCCPPCGSATPGPGAETARATGRSRGWRAEDGRVVADHASLGRFVLAAEPGPRRAGPRAALHRERDEHGAPLRRAERHARASRTPSTTTWWTAGRRRSTPSEAGTKAAALYRLELPPGGQGRRSGCASPPPTRPRAGPSRGFDAVVRRARRGGRRASTPPRTPQGMSDEERRGGPPGLRRAPLDQAVLPLRRSGTGSRAIPPSRRRPRSGSRAATPSWAHLYNRDVISMPDKWEYPWYAAWDLAFHMIPFAAPRPAVRQGPARAVPARVVHAPERPDPGLRVRTSAT